LRANEFKKIAKELLSQFPQLASDRKMIFRSPIEDLLCGLSFGDSIDANAFYVSRFFMPLYVPTESTFGERVRVSGNQGWRCNDPHLIENLADTIRRERSFLDRVSTLSGALDDLKSRIDRGRPRVNSHVLEAYACTLIKCGDYPSALESLAELKRMLEGDTIPWVVAQFDRAHFIELKLLQSPEAALAQMEAWKDETICKLGLEKYRGRPAA